MRVKIGEAAERSRRQAREHIVLGVPARPAVALDQKITLLAVERLEMRAIAARHLDTGRHANVETRLVVDQNDVRWRGLGPAGVRERLQAFGGDSIGLHQPMCRQFGNGVDAGAGEGGHEIAAVKGFERLQRKKRFERDKTGDTGHGGNCRNTPAHAQRIEAPGACDEGHQYYDAQRHRCLQRRENREQKSDGIGIDDHQIDEVRRHHQHVVFKLRQQHEQRHQHQGNEAGEQRPLHERDDDEIDDCPSQQECRHRDSVGLGRDHHRQGEDVRTAEKCQAAPTVPGRHRRNFLTQARNEGTHDGAPVPGNDLTQQQFPQRTDALS